MKNWKISKKVEEDEEGGKKQPEVPWFGDGGGRLVIVVRSGCFNVNHGSNKKPLDDLFIFSLRKI